MTSRVLKNKLNPTFGLFKSTVRKNLGVIVLLAVGVLILCPGLFLTTLSHINIKPYGFRPESPTYLDILFGVCGFASAVFVAVGNFISFSFLYKKNSSDVFHSLPLTRTGLFVSRAAASFVTVAIPLTLGYASLLALTAFYPTYLLGTFAQILSAYLVNLLCMLFVSGFTLIFIVCAGSTFDLIISFAGFNAAISVVGLIISNLSSGYLSGYSAENTDSILKAISPMVYCAASAVEFALGGAENAYSITGNIGFILITLGGSAAFIIASILLFGHRKTERGGQAYAYKFIYVICSILAGICGGYILSTIFSLAGDKKPVSYLGVISFIPGALLTVTVYGAVTERGFKKFKKSLVYGAVSAAAYFVILAVIMSGAFGFSTRVPEKNDVSYVEIICADTVLNLDDSTPAIALHKAIIDKDANDFEESVLTTPHNGVNIHYQLKNGREMFREYYADMDKVGNEMFAALNAGERFDDYLKAVEKLNSDSVEIDVYDYNNEPYNCIGTKKQLMELIKAYREDFARHGKKIVYGQDTLSVTVYSKQTEGDEYVFEIAMTDDFTETLSVLGGFKRIEY